MNTPVCFPATAAEAVAIAEHAAWHRITISEWVAMTVRRALETERVERVEGMGMAAVKLIEALGQRSGHGHG